MAAGKPAIVVSAVNLTEAGPLSILRDCLGYASRELAARYEVVALVHDAALVDAPGVRLLEFPRAKRSWLLRLYYEYAGFLQLSSRLNPFLWLSLHDTTPNVRAARRAVYCHNPSPFYRLRLRDAWLEPRFAAFVLFYGLLYSINLRKNRDVVVQQEWMREEFRSRFGVSNVIVAHPVPGGRPGAGAPASQPERERTVFFYPAFPRVFKNFEVIARAAARLRDSGVRNFEVRLTIDGTENRYARRIAAAVDGVPEVRLLGRQSRESVYACYDEADCLLFPSRLETWGLPLTEFRPLGKPILVADCRYAREAVGDYTGAAYFAPEDSGRLAELMRSVIERRFRGETRPAARPAEPYAANWEELFKLLLRE
jgi:glycosyltransferase involved in cell wall biosynthesis